jgi:tetratricopeptide (TPR) repeat protein
MKKVLLILLVLGIAAGSGYMYFIGLPRIKYMTECKTTKGPKSIEACTRFIERVPLYRYKETFYATRGLRYSEAQQYDKAVADFDVEIAHQKLPDRLGMLYSSRGTANMLARKFEQAKADFSKAIELNPAGAADQYQFRAIISMEQGDTKAALADAQKSVDLNPKLTSSLSTLASIYSAAKQPEKALECFNKVLELDPQSTEAASGIGALLAERGDFAGASKKYEWVLGKDPDNGRARRGMAGVYLAFNQYPKAAAECLEAVRVTPQNVNSHLMCARAYAALKDYDKASAYFAKAIEKGPQAKQYAFRADMYHAQGKYKEALQDYDAALKMKADEPGVLARRGINYLSLGDLESAGKDLGLIQVREVTAPDSGYLYLGNAYLAWKASKNKKMALAYLGSALKILSAYSPAGIKPDSKEEIRFFFKDLARDAGYKRLVKKYAL